MEELKNEPSSDSFSKESKEKDFLNWCEQNKKIQVKNNTYLTKRSRKDLLHLKILSYMI